MTVAGRQPFRLDVAREGNAAVVRVSGSVTITEADQLREALENLAAEHAPVMVLDLANMDFICSLGLGAIISGHLKCRHHRGQVRLVHPQPPVRELLETTRLTKLFGIYDSVAQALPET